MASSKGEETYEPKDLADALMAEFKTPQNFARIYKKEIDQHLTGSPHRMRGLDSILSVFLKFGGSVEDTDDLAELKRREAELSALVEGGEAAPDSEGPNEEVASEHGDD